MSKNNKQSAGSTGGKFSPTIKNKKAHFEYHLLEKFEAGIALLGTEVKSLRQGGADLEDAFGRLRDGELWLMGCTIKPYTHGNITNHEPARPRKLLVHRRELRKIESKINQKGLTLVPLRIYFSRGYVKVEIAIARGKSASDKRDQLRRKQQDIDVKRELKRYR
ncbi:MAG: SsrA-binding protein SmpB [Sedimentisphaerales bacterium]|nr:SsrA-binding protein SmpB [Sedimentisphaerales bacterium]